MAWSPDAEDAMLLGCRSTANNVLNDEFALNVVDISRYNIPGAWLLNRSPVPAMVLKSIRI